MGNPTPPLPLLLPALCAPPNFQRDPGRFELAAWRVSRSSLLHTFPHGRGERRWGTSYSPGVKFAGQRLNKISFGILPFIILVVGSLHPHRSRMNGPRVIDPASLSSRERCSTPSVSQRQTSSRLASHSNSSVATHQAFPSLRTGLARQELPRSSRGGENRMV
jgi:hypothetical protein